MKVFISDLHLGAGDALDDFIFISARKVDRKSTTAVRKQIAAMHQVFQAFADYILNKATKLQQSLELILLGDIFDLLQVEPAEELFLKPAKIHQINKAHSPFFSALNQLMRNGAKVTFVIGNHDHELVEKTMFKTLLQYLPNLNVQFGHQPLAFYSDSGNGIYAEHGNQFDPLNRFDDFNNAAELPFGSQLVLKVVNPYEQKCPLIDNIQGTKETAWFAVRHLPYLVARVLSSSLNLLWRRIDVPPQAPLSHIVYALTQKGLIPDDPELINPLCQILMEVYEGLLYYGEMKLQKRIPLKALSALGLHPIKIIKDIIETELRARLYKLLLKRKGKTLGKPPRPFDILMLGHTHKATIEEVKNKYYVNTGCWRPIAVPYRKQAFRLSQPLNFVIVDEDPKLKKREPRLLSFATIARKLGLIKNS